MHLNIRKISPSPSPLHAASTPHLTLQQPHGEFPIPTCLLIYYLIALHPPSMNSSASLSPSPPKRTRQPAPSHFGKSVTGVWLAVGKRQHRRIVVLEWTKITGFRLPSEKKSCEHEVEMSEEASRNAHCSSKLQSRQRSDCKTAISTILKSMCTKDDE